MHDDADFCILSPAPSPARRWLACILNARIAMGRGRAGGNMAFHASNNVCAACGGDGGDGDGGVKVDGGGGSGGAFLLPPQSQI